MTNQMSKFEQLPGNYRDAINKAIDTCVGNEYQEIVAAYREHEASSLLECDISGGDAVDTEEFESAFVNFMAGWEERGKVLLV